MKKYILLILFLPILVIAEECTTYNDIDNSTYKQDILYASDRGWITCREESSPFNPTLSTNRIEALKMALLAGGKSPQETTEQCFDDVATDSWQNKYVCYGLNNGLLVERDNFRPDEGINFAEASKLILRSITSDSYSETSEPWYDKYFEKMALYGFELDKDENINRDYFVYMLRVIEADPNKQKEVIEEEEEEETPIDDTTEEDNETVVIDDDNGTIVIDDNATTENNETIVEDDNRTISGLSYMFTPYRCYGTTPPTMELKTLSDTLDSDNNRIMELEFNLSGGTQSCVDEYGESHNLEIFTQWWAKDAVFEDLTSSGSDIRYKHIRVTIPSDRDNEVYLEIITSLGSRVDSQITIDENGDIIVETTYGLNGIEVKDPAILAKIKSVIAKLESIKLDVSALVSKTRTTEDDDLLRTKYDAIKQRLDGAMSMMDAVKQAIDNSDEDKEALKAEADKIKQSIEDIKTLIDGYKLNADNSPDALEDINSAIDGVIAMMRSSESDEVETTSISIKQGRNTVSGNIDITTLPDTIHSIWIVDGGNWYGYSPYEGVRDEIEAKYLLIEDSIVNSKGILVFAMEDTQIESSDSSNDIEHSYGLGYTLHGTNGESMSASDIVCDDSNAVVMVATVRGDEPSVYVPEREIDGIENFEYLDSDDGYYILCDKE